MREDESVRPCGVEGQRMSTVKTEYHSVNLEVVKTRQSSYSAPCGANLTLSVC